MNISLKLGHHCKLKIIIHWIALPLILLTIWSCSNELSKILPIEGTLTESVYASNTFRADSLYRAYTIVAGILYRNFVEEGDIFMKGEMISQIISNTPKLNS